MLVAAANMAFASWILYSARTVNPTLDPAQFAAVLNTVAGPATAERSEIRSLVVTTAMVMNDHAVMLVTVTFAFALMALGFSLFVMGIESTYGFSAEQPNFGRVSITATTPGLVCFVLATALMAFTVTHRTPVYDPSAAPDASVTDGAKNSTNTSDTTRTR